MLFRTAIHVAALLALVVPAPAQVVCKPIADQEDKLQNVFREGLMLRGFITMNGQEFPMRMYVNAQTGTWTMTFRPLQPGMLCFFAVGTGLEPIKSKDGEL